MPTPTEMKLITKEQKKLLLAAIASLVEGNNRSASKTKRPEFAEIYKREVVELHKLKEIVEQF